MCFDPLKKTAGFGINLKIYLPNAFATSSTIRSSHKARRSAKTGEFKYRAESSGELLAAWRLLVLAFTIAALTATARLGSKLSVTSTRLFGLRSILTKPSSVLKLKALKRTVIA